MWVIILKKIIILILVRFRIIIVIYKIKIVQLFKICFAVRTT